MKAAGDRRKFSEERRYIALLVQVLHLSKGLLLISTASRIGLLKFGTIDIWGEKFFT